MLALSPNRIRSVLVANRGEIAIRVFRTCARLGIRTVAVYSDADLASAHVHVADAATRIGPAAARESYLDINAVIAAARRMDVDAIHPGYGFLSENADFARACAAAGFIFIGPSADAVERMGSKIEAKRIAEAAGVPTVPGYHGDAQDPDTLLAAAERIGFPVLIKASAGGGGRGMRRVDRPQEFVAALGAARAEAATAFGNADILLEKLIQAPRHLEVQIAGDKNGNLVHLFERDCSVQRNNQKILEEAPAPNLPDPVRTRLYDAALTLGRAIHYDSVGTVEFIMNAGSEQPYFLEMNTRLQVEHPVTEAITGIDLVEWQIKAAAGELLPLRQDEIHQAGHAIEARITAERADLDFQPATGHVARVAAPADLRFDAGIVDGSEVGLYYDSLLGKLIAFGRTRETSLARLQTGLNELVLLGLPTTQAFLHDAVRHPIFRAGRATTRFVTMAYPEGWRPDSAELRYLRAAASAAWLVDQRGKDTGEVWTNPWLRPRPLRITGAARPAQVAVVLSDEYGSCDLHLSWTRTGVLAEIEGHVIDLGAVEINGDNLFTGDGRLPYLGTKTAVCLSRNGVTISVTVNLRIERRPMLQESGAKRDRVDAPLHGMVSQINVSVGDSVMAGTAVIQMEAMKLVHTLGAPGPGIVSSIHCAVGDIVPAGAVLLTLKAAEEKELP